MPYVNVQISQEPVTAAVQHLRDGSRYLVLRADRFSLHLYGYDQVAAQQARQIAAELIRVADEVEAAIAAATAPGPAAVSAGEER